MLLGGAFFLYSCSGSRPRPKTIPETVPAPEPSIDVGQPIAADVPAAPAAVSDEKIVEPEIVEPEPTEIRAVWVTRWDFQQAEDIERIMAELGRAGFNLVYFQIRGAADAYYRSTLEPWAASLTGRLGGDPGWDPLAVAIEAAHGQNMQLHAWINLATGWKGKRRPGRSRPTHILRKHPEWRVADGKGRPMPYAKGYIFLNPANPAFAHHLEGVVGEIASFYAIDGLHLDYARYPAAQTSRDRVCLRLFRKARKQDPSLDLAAWQRAQLLALVKRLKQAAQTVRPQLMVSAAVTGIYRDRWNWQGVTQGYLDFHQDSHRWAEQAAVDTLVPMIYWPPTSPPGGRTDFATLAADFAPLSGQVQLLAGINVDAGDLAVLHQEIKIARKHGFAGVALFSYQLLKQRNWLAGDQPTLFPPKDPQNETIPPR